MMKKLILLWAIILVLIKHASPQGFVIDHSCTDLSKIPYSYIEKIKTSQNVFHYATRSHGQRITAGLEEIRNTTGTQYPVLIREQNMPDLLSEGLKMYVNMPSSNYVTTTEYWNSAAGVEDLRLLFQNSNIKYSLWVFCGELTDENSGPNNIVYRYLDSINSLEQRFPSVKFIYTTSHSQSYGLQCWQYKARDSANSIIRNYCYQNNKILFDFGDIECWENGVEQIDACLEWNQTYLYYQAQLPRFRVDGPGHTTMENAVQYGKAFWWLISRLNGWDGGLGGDDTEAPTAPTNLRSSNVHDVGCTLQWNPSTDNVNVTGYKVYRGTTLIGTPRSTTLAVTGLSPNTNYSFTVYACDFNGNISTVSNQINITTLNQLPTVNLARGKTITASSSENQYFPGSFANDGNTNSRWSSAYSDPQWLSVDLGMVYSISRVVLDWENTSNYGRSYQIQVSNNGTDWSDIYSTTSGVGGTENLTNIAGVGRYIRFYGTQRSLPYGYSIKEFEVYGILGNGTADIEAPTTPTNLSVSGISATTFNLSWNASTDNIGVVNYSVYKNGSIVGTTANTSIYISELSSATTYNMTVLANDAAGNSSPISSALNVTTLIGNITLNDFITGTSGGIVYRLYIPRAYNPNVSYPMVVFLHGAGERGSNNTSQMTEWPLLFAQDSNQVRWPSFVLAPQCPYDQQWVNTPWGSGSYSTDNISISSGLTAVNDIIGQIQSSYNINSNKLYLTGLSMGGYGTWDFISRYPSKFAAAIPICGGGDPTKASIIKNIPLRFYHSNDDGVVPVSGSRDMNNALIAVNATDAVYKEYTNLDHISWPAAYNEAGLLPWLFAQSKENVVNVPVTGVSLSSNSISLLVNQTANLTATVAPNNATNKNVTWVSSNTAIATVNQGIVTGISQGNANITVTTIDGGYNATCAVNVSNPVDNTPPSTPLNLHSTFVGNESCTIAWNASTDNIGVTGYNVFVGNVLIGTTSSTSYTVSGLSAGQTYSFTVFAFDNAGNISGTSATLAVTTNNGQVNPTPITSLQNGDKVLFIGNSFTEWSGPLPSVLQSLITASGSGLNVDFTFKVKGMGILKEYATWSSLGIIAEIQKGGWKYVVIQGWSDALGLKDSQVNEDGTTNTDYIGYPASQDTMLKYLKVLDAEIKKVGATTILYEPHVSKVAFVNDMALSHSTYTKLHNNVASFYAPVINSWDEMRLRYPATDLGCETYTRGSFADFLYADCGHQNTNGMMLDALTFYTIFTKRSGSTLKPIAMMTRPDLYEELAEVAYNTGKSILTMNGCGFTDIQAPSVPAGLNVSNLLSDSYTINWTASSDDIGVLGYKVYQNDVLLGITAIPKFNVGNLLAGTRYDMKISAFDSEGKNSAFSSILSVTTPALMNVDTTGVLVDWDFTAQGGNASVFASNVMNGVSASSPSSVIAYGNGFSASSYNINGFGMARQDNASLSAAIAANQYITFSIAPQSGNFIGIDSIKINVFSQNQPRNFTLMSSISGFTNGNQYGTLLNDGYFKVSGLSNITSNIEFRIYVWGPSGGGTSYESFGLTDLQIFGMVKSNALPTFPTGLNATELTESGFKLNWRAAQNAVSYEVFINGSSIGTTTSLSMAITNVSINSIYNMTVKAINNNGIISEESQPLSVKIPDTHTPSVPVNLTATGVTQNSFVLRWAASTDNVGVVLYEINMNGAVYGNTADIYLPVPLVNANTSYSMTVRSKDAFGNVSAFSAPFVVTTLPGIDNVAPSAPTNLRTETVGETGCRIAWNASSDNVGVTGYNVYMGTTLIGTSTSTNYTVSGLALNQTYTFTVYAKDAANNISTVSPSLNVTTIANPVGSAIASWYFYGMPANSSPVSLATSNVASGISLVAPSGVATIASGIIPGTDYWGNGLTAYSNDATTLSEAISLNEYISFTIAPQTGKVITVNSIKIRPASQNRERTFSLFSNITGYSAANILGSVTGADNINEQIKTVSMNNINKISSPIEFRVYIHCNPQNSWETVGIGNGNATTPDISIEGVVENANSDTEAPTLPSGLNPTAINSNSFTLNWLPSTDNVGVIEYEVFKNTLSCGTTSSASLSITGLTCATMYSMTVKAKDAAGNISQASSLLNVTTSACPDTQSPSIPVSLVASNVTTNSFTLNWNASTDNVGVTAYLVYLNGSYFSSTNATSLNIGSLSAATNYSIAVSATDAAGNNSGLSNGLNVTTLEQISISNLALNKPSFASSTENIYWVAGLANDNNTSSRWSSEYSDPQWIYVDLGTSCTLSSVVFLWETAYGSAYQIQVSNDATNWTNIYSTTTGNGGTDNITGLSASGRYVRMYGTQRGTGWGYSLFDFAVFGYENKNMMLDNSAQVDRNLFSIFPNPIKAGETFNITGLMVDELTTIKIVNIAGKVVKNEELNANQSLYQFNTNDLSSGLFMIQIKNSKQTINAKLIIK